MRWQQQRDPEGSEDKQQHNRQAPRPTFALGDGTWPRARIGGWSGPAPASLRPTALLAYYGELFDAKAVVTLRHAPEGARTASRLLPQGEVADRHRTVARLAHVVHGEGGHRAGRHGLHLDAGAVDRLDLGLDLDVLI